MFQCKILIINILNAISQVDTLSGWGYPARVVLLKNAGNFSFSVFLFTFDQHSTVQDISL